MEISSAHLGAVLASPLRAQVLVALRASGLERIGFMRANLERLPAADLDALHDACLDFLRNEAPEVERYKAQQDLDPYRIVLRGVPGAYFVGSDDGDPEVLIATLEEARDCRMEGSSRWRRPDRSAGLGSLSRS